MTELAALSHFWIGWIFCKITLFHRGYLLCTGVNLGSNLIKWELINKTYTKWSVNKTSIMIHRRNERCIADRQWQKRVQLDVNTGSLESSFRTFRLNDPCHQFSCWFVHGVDWSMLTVICSLLNDSTSRRNGKIHIRTWNTITCTCPIWFWIYYITYCHLSTCYDFFGRNENWNSLGLLFFI